MDAETENKIQEAEGKWIDIKNQYKNLQLHMVGKLQTNKSKKAVKLFDYIHSVDNAKRVLHPRAKENKGVDLVLARFEGLRRVHFPSC